MPARTTGGRKLKEFLRKAKAAAAKSKGVDVGFFASAKYSPVRQGVKGGQARKPHYVATVAAWNEFGTPTIPERPFFRNAIAGADRVLNPIIKAGIDPKTMEFDDRTAALVGEAMKARIQNSIRDLKTPANAEITVKGGWMRSKSGKLIHIPGKQSDNPLIDEGFMRSSVDYQVSGPGETDR